MLRQIEVGSMGDAFQLAEAGRRERKAVFDIARAGALAGVVRQLVRGMRAQLQVVPRKTQSLPPAHALLAPECIPVARLLGMAEELDLHLLELAAAEGEIAWRDLVAKSF